MKKHRYINPDGLLLYVPVDDLVTGDSIFVPCINVGATIKQFSAFMRKNNFATKYKISEEHNILGVRFWLTLC